MSKTVQGFILIDVDVAALNNAGKDKTSTLENSVETKKIRKGNKNYVYVSGQAFRYWWRETLKRGFGWNMSPITREDKIAFTEANPIKYEDDDIFGYMRAAKEVQTDDEGNPIKDNKGREKKVDVTLTRVSPLKNSALISVSSVSPAKNFSSMTRQEENPVPYGKDEYCAVMKGMFSISLEQAGTFSSEKRTGFKNLNDFLINEAKKSGCSEINDPFAMNKKSEPLKLYRLSKELRTKRITDPLLALEIINGGAMQACNMADVTPKLIVLCTLNSGNHLFSHLAKDDLGKAVFSIEALKQVADDYKDRIIGKIYIGRRTGFMDELQDELTKYAQEKSEKIFYGSINEAIKNYVAEVVQQIPE